LRVQGLIIETHKSNLVAVSEDYFGRKRERNR